MIKCEKYNDFDVYSEQSEKQFRYIHIKQPNFYKNLCEHLLSFDNIREHASMNIDVEQELSLENYREIYDRLLQFIDFEKIVNIDEYVDPVIKSVLDDELISDSKDLRKDKWGRIGEYIFNIILDTYFNLDCVIRKFALSTSPNMPIYGIDTVHCSLEDNCFYFGESKFVKDLTNGIKLINESLCKYESEIAKEYFTISNNNFRRNDNFLEKYQKYITTCLTFSEFINELKITKIRIPIFIAHAGKFEENEVFKKLRGIKRNNFFGLHTEYIAISFPILDKDVFRESFIAEVNNQLGEVKKCLKA